MAKFSMPVSVLFVVTVKARDRAAAEKKLRERALGNSTMCLSDLTDDSDMEWGLGESQQDMDWDGFKEIK